jgi:hypothetical protein
MYLLLNVKGLKENRRHQFCLDMFVSTQKRLFCASVSPKNKNIRDIPTLPRKENSAEAEIFYPL